MVENKVERIDIMAEEPEEKEQVATHKVAEAKQCPVNDWQTVGWIYRSKSEKVLKVALTDKEGKTRTVGVFFPVMISNLYSGQINAIPIKYKKPKENESELSDKAIKQVDSARQRIKETGGVSEAKAKELLN